MKHSFNTLRYQFLGLLLPVFLIVSIAISFSSILSMNYKLENLYRTTNDSIVRTLIESLKEPLKKNDFNAAADMLSRYENNNEIHGIELKNQGYNEIYSSYGKDYQRRNYISNMSEKWLKLLFQYTVGNEETVSITIQDDDKVQIGQLTITFCRHEINLLRREYIINSVCTISLITIGLFLAAALSVEFLINVPLKSISKAMKGYVPGIDIDIGDQHNNEIGQLARSFQSVSAKLNRNDRDLKDTIEELKQTNLAQTHTLKELKETQEELVRSEKMASLGQLVAGIAHEINTPIGIGVTGATMLQRSIRKLLSLLEDEEIEPDEFNTTIVQIGQGTDLILSNLEKAAKLISTFKQTAVDQTTQTRRVFNVMEYIQGTILTLSPIIKKTPHKIEINCDESMTIDSYPGPLAQIITNLVTNSINHAFEDRSDPGLMRINVTEQGSNYCMKFSDNGKGILPDILPDIFDPFVTTKRGKGGTGLGLNVVYNIVTQVFGGTIRCESRENKGTTFIIEFPE